MTMSEERFPKLPPGKTRRAKATSASSRSFRDISVIIPLPASVSVEKTIFEGSHASCRRLDDMVHANPMHVVPVAPDIDPALVLTDGAIRSVFAPTTLEAGRIYELRGRVRNLRITGQGGL